MEVWFYHLQRQPLERVLPKLLEMTLARGWRGSVEVSSAERLIALDDHLWTYADDSFLPHGRDGEGEPGRHPVFLTQSRHNLNAAQVRFLVDGARWGDDLAGYERVMLVFDGDDPDALARAREDWKAVKAAGHEAAYWQQSAEGRWEKKA